MTYYDDGNPNTQEVSKIIKEVLTNTLFLVIFDLKAEHIIQVDGMMKGFSAILQKGRPVIYVFRRLMPAEKAPLTSTELLSVVFRLERLHHYIFVSRVEVQTDHKLLIPIWKKSTAAASP